MESRVEGVEWFMGEIKLRQNSVIVVIFRRTITLDFMDVEWLQTKALL